LIGRDALKNLPLLSLSACLLLLPAPALADDASSNIVAAKIKKKLLKQLAKMDHIGGFCDVMLEVEYTKRARVVKVRTNGYPKLCHQVKKLINEKKRYKYKHTERYLRIQIDQMGY
jgi:hypothetical protein